MKSLARLRYFSLIVFAAIVFCLLHVSFHVQAESAGIAQEELLEGAVIKVLEREGDYQRLQIKVTRGSLEGEQIEVTVGKKVAKIGQPSYQVGDRVVISRAVDEQGESVFFVTDYLRRPQLVWLFIIFLILAVLVGGRQGATSLIGMAISFLIIFGLILPQISRGRDPTLVTIGSSLIIIPVTFFLSHGLNKKTAVAVLATLISLALTGLLAKWFVELTQLTGYSTDEAAFLEAVKGQQVNVKGLVLAGIIVGVLGILDDVTVAQAALVQKLREADRSLSQRELFLHSLSVGRDHIASMINTLVLVYAGASLPLLLLFINSPVSFTEVINQEIIAEEVVRTLVGSIGLILAVPITSLIASWWE